MKKFNYSVDLMDEGIWDAIDAELTTRLSAYFS